MLQVDPEKRLNIDQILNNKWVTKVITIYIFA